MDYTRPGSSRGSSVEATQVSYAHVAELFEYFIYAITMKHILALYREMCRALNLRPNRLPDFYPILKAKLGKNWRADGIFKKLDAKIANNIYGKNIICRDTRVLVVGAGPCGLRVAIECQLLGAKVVVVEKRDRMSRHNVLHLWPFVVEDLISLGAKRYFPRFCSGPIDHISIRQLQYMLLKVALLLGVEFFEGVAFEELLEPTISADGESKGWRARVIPKDHPVAQYEFDVLIGADGKRNTLKGFKRSEFRGKLAIGITVNFIHHRTQLEASVPELSGRSYHFHQDYFNELTEKTGIELENIVYYKGDTHYFVMTAKKNSLLRRKVLKEDFAEVSKLLSVENVDNKALLEFARDAARYAVNYKLPLNDFALNHYLEPDCALFDFTTFYAAENACVVFELKGYSLLCQLVGDSLLEPFWPTGSGCARGFLSALDAAWQIRSWGMITNTIHPVDLIAERESLYKFLPYTDPNNMCTRVNKYTIDPTTRYLTKDRKEMPLARCKALYQSDDPAPIEAPRVGKRPTNLQVSENVLLRWTGRDGDHEINEESMPGIVLKIMCLYRPDLLPRSPTFSNAVSVLATKFNIAPLCSNADKADIMEYVCKIYNIFKGEVPYVPVHTEKDILQQIRNRPSSTPKYSVQTSVISKSSDKDRKPRKRRSKMSVSKPNYSDYISKKIGKLKVEDITKLARLIDGHEALQHQDENKEKQMTIQNEIINLLQSDSLPDEKLSRAQIIEMLQGSKKNQNHPHYLISHYFRGKKEHGKKSQRKLKGLASSISPHYFGEYPQEDPSRIRPEYFGDDSYSNAYILDDMRNQSAEYFGDPMQPKAMGDFERNRESESPDITLVQRRSNSIAGPEIAISDIASRYDAKGNPDKEWRRQRIAEIIAGHEAKTPIDLESMSRTKRSNSIGPDMAQKMQRVTDLIEGGKNVRGTSSFLSGGQKNPSSLALRMQRVSDFAQDGSTEEGIYPRRRVSQGMARDRFKKCMEILCSGPSPFAVNSADLDNDYGLQQYRASAPHFDERVRLLERQLRQSDDFSVESSPKKKLYSKGRVKKLAAELADQKEPAKLSKQKPKDLLRAIGKIEPSDWHLRQIEKKIRDNQLGRPMPKKAERVPQWDRVQFLERQQRLKEVDATPPSTSMPTEVKYKDLPDQGTKKVASLADKFRQSNDTPDKQNSTSEKVKAWVGPQVQNVRCVVCKKVVFHAESANADGVQLHKNCFRCIICNTNLRPGNFRVQRCTESPMGPVKIFCLKHSSEPIRAPPPRVSAYVRPLPRDPIPEPIPTPPPEQEYVSMEISSPTTPKRLSWTGMTSSTTPPRECDEDEWTDLNNLASDMFIPNSDEDEDDSSTDGYEDAVSEEEDNAHPKTSLYTPESLLLIRPRHDPTDSTAGYDDMSDDGGSSSGASCSRMREALEARRREVPPAVEMLGTSDSSEDVESEDDDEPSDEESSATEVSTDSEFAREESGSVPSPPAITVTEAPPLSLPPLVPDYTPVQPPASRAPPRQDYPLSRTRSTGGIATKRALELKKRYLLGDLSASSVKKSDSTSRLDVKLQMVQSSISEFQKLLNPAPVTTSFVTVNFPSPLDTKPTIQNMSVFERSEQLVSDDTPSKLSSIEDTVKEVVLDAHEKDALEASKEELDTDTLSEDVSSTIGKTSQDVPRLEVHNAAGELVQVNEVALEVKSEDEDLQSTALTETELSDWAADSAVDDCVPDSVIDKHTRTPNKGPRSLSGPKSVYDSNTAPMHVCGKDLETQPIMFSNALDHFEFADEGEQDLGVAAAVNRGFMELVLDNRTTDHDRSMEFIEKSLNTIYIGTNDTERNECTVKEETPPIVSPEPLEVGFSDGPDLEGNYRRKQSLGLENNNKQSLHLNGTNENIRTEYKNIQTPTKEFDLSSISIRSDLGFQSPACRSLDSSVDVKVQEMKRKKDEETEIVRQLVLGKHGNMNRRNVKKYRPPEWTQLPPPVPPLPCELSPPPPPPPPTPVVKTTAVPALVSFGHRVATSASDPDLTKKNNFLKTLLHLPQRIYLRTKWVSEPYLSTHDSSWSSSSTHKSTSALSPPPVPSPPLNYRPTDEPYVGHSKHGDSGADHTLKSKISPSTSGPIPNTMPVEPSRMDDAFSPDSSLRDLRLGQIEKKLLKPHKMTAEEQAAAVAMLVEIKAQRDAHKALRAADRQRGTAGVWDCRYK